MTDFQIDRMTRGDNIGQFSSGEVTPQSPPAGALNPRSTQEAVRHYGDIPFYPQIIISSFRHTRMEDARRRSMQRIDLEDRGLRATVALVMEVGRLGYTRDW